MDPDDKKVKINWFYPKRIVIDTIWGDQFLYISLELDYRHSSYCYSIFLLILWCLFSVHSFSFILLHSFHLHLSRVDQIIGVDPCTINTFLKSLGVAVKLKITIHVSLPH